MLITTIGCHDHEADEINAQARVLHDSLMVIEREVHEAIERYYAQDVDTMSEAILDSVDAIEADFHVWEEHIIEPFGAPEEGEDHGHDHSHESAPEMTPAQMLEVQQALLDGILVLKARVDSLAKMTDTDTE